MVECGRQREHAIGGVGAMRRLEASDATERRRNPHRSARVRTDRERRRPIGDRRRASAARAARHTVRRRWVRSGAGMRVDTGDAKRELVQGDGAQCGRSCGAQTLDDRSRRCLNGRIDTHRATGLGPTTLNGQQGLDRERVHRERTADGVGLRSESLSDIVFKKLEPRAALVDRARQRQSTPHFARPLRCVDGLSTGRSVCRFRAGRRRRCRSVLPRLPRRPVKASSDTSEQRIRDGRSRLVRRGCRFVRRGCRLARRV